MKFFGLNIYEGKYSDLLKVLKSPKKPTLIFTPNPEILLQASHDQEFFSFLEMADILTPDGTGLYTGSLILEGTSYFQALITTLFKKKKLQKRYGELIKGSDLTRDLIDFSQKEKKRVMMIDSYRITEPKNTFEEKKMQTQKTLRELFHQKFPTLEVEILFDGEMSPDAIAHMVELKNISYIFSCIGMKKQEQRLAEIFSYLPEDQKVVGLGVGSSIDYLLGLQKRAPQIFQKLGLEWFYRLMLEPRKRWRRIYTAVIEFPRIVSK